MKTLNESYRDIIISRLINSPETLTSEDITLIQNDKELSELYNAANLLQESSALKNIEIPDIETELIKFKTQRKKIRPIKPWVQLMRIAAIFIIIAITSIVIVAAFNPQIVDYITGYDSLNEIESIEKIKNTSISTTSGTIENIVITNDHELIYDNISLKSITDELSEIYKIDVVYINKQATELRLYLKIEQDKTIQDVVEMLQSFELFATTFENNTLTIQ
ncbi:MAG: DUF4974 domain-containing protein [Muribaculaceae bacterium]|nr:DUF4974 domain-containing protein [Muribaculaceae bacterium]